RLPGLVTKKLKSEEVAASIVASPVDAASGVLASAIASVLESAVPVVASFVGPLLESPPVPLLVSVMPPPRASRGAAPSLAPPSLGGAAGLEHPASSAPPIRHVRPPNVCRLQRPRSRDQHR